MKSNEIFGTGFHVSFVLNLLGSQHLFFWPQIPIPVEPGDELVLQDLEGRLVSGMGGFLATNHRPLPTLKESKKEGLNECSSPKYGRLW